MGNILDLLGWVALIVALYIGWQSGRWDTTRLTCDMITPDFCNTCFVYGKQLITGGIEPLNLSLGQ